MGERSIRSHIPRPRPISYTHSYTGQSGSIKGEY